jgi:hypothetical protein
MRPSSLLKAMSLYEPEIIPMSTSFPGPRVLVSSQAQGLASVC